MSATSPSPARPAAKRSAPKSARRRSRELALQGLYEWLISGAEAGTIDAHMREQGDFERADQAVYYAKSHGRNQVADHLALVARGELVEDRHDGDVELF